MTRRHGSFTLAFLLLVLSFGLGLAGCEGSDGAPGRDGLDGAAGTPGADGQACWDLNGNGIGDPEEDVNGDGTVDVYDCNAYADGAYEIDQLHAGYFTEHPYEGTASCLNCHGKLADEILETAHFTWKGLASNIVNVPPGSFHGKVDILNNFCVAVPTNEARCTQCHAGYGWKDASFDFGDPDNIDCLICHDQTDTYEKDEKTAGAPRDTIDLQAVARSVAMNGGKPSIDNCIDCHAKAGGGNNVKHGDLAMALQDTTREFDVHMGKDGRAQFVCVDCHDVKRDGVGKPLSHGIGGMPYHSVEEGNMKNCDDCHGSAASIHAGTSVAQIVGSHDVLACQVCHIPTFARHTATKTEWYWKDAGDVARGVETDPVTNLPIYDPKKGSFVWTKDVRPTLRYFDGTWNKAIIGVADTYTSEPAVLGAPVGSHDDGKSMIYPFKKMIGNQVADPVAKRIMVPHLFGTAGGPNPYWGTWDWDLSLQDASQKTGQPYTPGSFDQDTWFVDTVMYLTVNHEVAPKEMAYGFGNNCGDCHFDNKIDWTELGWSGDPVDGGVRP